MSEFDAAVVSASSCTGRRGPVPCRTHDPDLWFAESPMDLEHAKQLCARCPIRTECLITAMARQEPWGVWGGQILHDGSVIARKRPRGRPRKNDTETGQSPMPVAGG